MILRDYFTFAFSSCFSLSSSSFMYFACHPPIIILLFPLIHFRRDFLVSSLNLGVKSVGDVKLSNNYGMNSILPSVFVSEMFDWDDQEIATELKRTRQIKTELANILWGQTNQADDHIVPYTEEIKEKPLPLTVDNGKRELNGEAANSKSAEQKIHVTQSNSYGGAKESNDDLSAAGVMDLQPDSSLLTASKTDQNGIAEKAELQGGPENSQSKHEDKELDELVDNNWANIGSFDDLDQIFGNDDFVGHPNLVSTDELWSSTDMINDAEKSSSLALDPTSWGSGALGATSGPIEINSEQLQNDNPLFTPACADSTSNTEKSLCASVYQVEYAVDTATCLLNEKIKSEPDIAAGKMATLKKSYNKNGSENKSRHGPKADKAIDNRLPPGVQVQHFDSQFAPATVPNYPSSALSQQMLPLESGLSPHHHCSNPYSAHYACRNFIEQYTAVPLLLPTSNEFQSGVSEAYPGDLDSFDKSSETSAKLLNMTPQEKIDKLRRRQQIWAMLAIQKQQQQLGHQVSAADYSMTVRPQEDQIPSMERMSLPLDENSSTPCCNLDSPIKWVEASTNSVEVEGHTMEDAVLCQLQGIIDKLDITIRLCIRDSLFRLAHSAMQRHHASEMGSIKRSCTFDLDASKEDKNSCDRFAGMPNVETETNHIDRAVAHLLFHQPFKLSGKPIETLESLSCTKVPWEQETDPSSLLLGFSAKSTQNQHNPSPKGLKFAHTFSEHHQEDIFEEILGTQTKMNQGVKEKMEHVD